LRDGRRPARTARGPEPAPVPRVVPAKIRIPTTQALARTRLEARLAEAWRHRLTLVIAPAGSGKTTLVAGFASAADAPVGWYRAETWDADEASFIRHVEAALSSVLPDLPPGSATVADLARSLEACPPSSVALVIDDSHAIEGSAAEAALGRLVDYAPPWLSIVVAGRVPPSINLPRLRVSGDLLELGQDDLRFRAWEVEQLFRDVYRDPIPPADLAVLARRTEGWAAGLQLFHLATRGRPVEERRRVLGGAGSSGRLLREYLAQNVLSGLPDDLRGFLLETCVLGRLSGSLCDRLLGGTGSAAMLDELARRGVFTVPVEGAEDAFRYHSVLRQHLDRMLVEALGEAEARARHARAGELLEADGALSEALRAYCRAEDWDAVRRLLGRQGEHLAATGRGAWIDAVPAAIERHDPWVALAVARRARNDGRWAAAIEGYLRAEAAFGPSRAADAPRRERQATVAWLDPAAMPTADALGSLRSGLVREPMTAARAASPSDPTQPVARGLLLLAAGELRDAQRELSAAANQGVAGPLACAAARLGALTADRLGGQPWSPTALDQAVEEAERAGSPWLARLGRALGHVLGGGPLEEILAVGDELDGRRPDVADRADGGVGTGITSTTERAAGGRMVGANDAGGRTPGETGGRDPWLPAILQLAAAWAAADDADRRLQAADRAASAFRRLGVGVLEAWSRGLIALASASLGGADARDLALVAESAGRSTGTQVPRLFAYAALAAVDAAHAGDYELMAAALEAETGLVPPLPRPAADATLGAAIATAGAAIGRETEPAPGIAGASSPTDVEVRTLGGFSLQVGGRPVSLEGAKPRVRSLLRLLAMHAGTPVHREVIQDALWPEVDAAAGARSLHVALSALRRWLDDVAPPLGGGLVERDGDAYRLAVPATAVDVGSFEQSLALAGAARARGEAVGPSLSAALELYRGDLLPEEGPADWVVGRRDHLRVAAVEAAQRLAEECLLTGNPGSAARACRVGLELDRYQDALWRMLIEAREVAGDAGAASRDRREYAALLADLGVADPVQVAT
jgi:serine/threonine-protein kinase PknK